MRPKALEMPRPARRHGWSMARVLQVACRTSSRAAFIHAGAEARTKARRIQILRVYAVAAGSPRESACRCRAWWAIEAWPQQLILWSLWRVFRNERHPLLTRLPILLGIILSAAACQGGNKRKDERGRAPAVSLRVGRHIEGATRVPRGLRGPVYCCVVISIGGKGHHGRRWRGWSACTLPMADAPAAFLLRHLHA